VNPLVLVVDDEPDVEALFRQQFRRDLRTDRFTMEFAQSAPMAFQRIPRQSRQCFEQALHDRRRKGVEPFGPIERQGRDAF
jgi:CheY-like chemotaxis protein